MMLGCVESLRTSLLGSTEERVRLLLAEHGERAAEVLKAALDRSREVELSLGERRLGDFDYKGVKKILESRGISYNPSLLLRKMERDYDLIETTYRSSNKHWWRFTDKRGVMNVVAPERVPKDPEAMLLKAQYVALEPEGILGILEELKNKERLEKRDIRIFRKIVFEEAEKVVALLKRMEERENLYEEEIRVLSKIIEDIEMITARLEKRTL